MSVYRVTGLIAATLYGNIGISAFIIAILLGIADRLHSLQRLLTSTVRIIICFLSFFLSD